MITYRQDRVTVADMFAAIWVAGRKQGREFMPEVGRLKVNHLSR